MDWTGSNKANIFMEHNYFKCEPMDSDRTNVEEGVTRCICDFDHDDGYMISCDGCMVWQHVDCVGNRDKLPEKYYCEVCHPRKFDKHAAIRIQSKKREDILSVTYRGVDDFSATESEDETKGDGPSTDTNNRLHAHSKKSPEAIQKKLTRGQRNERMKKELKPEKKKNVEVEKHLKRNKQRAAPISRTRDSNDLKPQDNGLHQILEAIDHKEHESIHLPPPPNHPNHVNSYTPELQKLLPNIKYNQDSLNSFSPSELAGLRKSLCQATIFENDPDRLVLRATSDVTANCPIIEYVGKVMLRDQFHDRWQPHVLFYSKLCGLDLCIDATSFINSGALHVRRSCTPNADIRHYLRGNSLRFFLHASKDIPSGSEITIGFDFNYHKCGFPVECACTRASCPVARYQRKECNLKKSHNTRDSKPEQTSIHHNSMQHRRLNSRSNQCDSNNGLQSPPQTPVKASDHPKMLNPMPSCLNKVRTSSESSNHGPHTRYLTSRDSDSEHTDSYNTTSPNDEKENSQKKSREEKKLEFYVKAIEKLEKSEKEKKGIAGKYKYKKEGRKLHFNEKNNEPCLDSLADAAAALASLSGNIDMSTLQKEDIHNISKRYTMLQTSSMCISPDAFNTNASNSLRRQSDTSSSSHDKLDRSFSSPTSYIADPVRIKEERNSFSSNDTHLDAATTLSLMSCQLQSPDSKQNIIKIPQVFESENLPLQQPEGAFTHSDQDIKGCHAKKRWLNRAMVSSQSSDGDIATPPKKRRLVRESVASDDNNEPESVEPIPSIEQKPPESKTSYQPVCESITDDEDEEHQQNMYCVPPGMVYPSFANLSTNALFSLHPTHPLYSIPGAMVDPYQYYSSLNLLQNMAITSTPIHHPNANQANGIPTTTASIIQLDAPIDDEKPANIDCSNTTAAQQDTPFVHPPYTMQQQFFHKTPNMMEAYFPLVMFPGGHQFPYPIPTGMHPLGTHVPLSNGESVDLHSPVGNHILEDKLQNSEERNRVTRVEMVSPPLLSTPTNGAGFTHKYVNSPPIRSENDSLT